MPGEVDVRPVDLGTGAFGTDFPIFGGFFYDRSLQYFLSQRSFLCCGVHGVGDSVVVKACVGAFLLSDLV